MEAKQAIVEAKQKLEDIFSDEGLAGLRLEEVEFDDIQGIWNITLGLSRLIQQPGGLSIPLGFNPRDYKVVRIRDSDGSVISIKNREPNA